MIKDKIDTLFFVLGQPMLFHDYDQLMDSIAKQANNFYERFGYMPAYINMEHSVYLYLERLVTEISIRDMGPTDRVFGMEIKTRGDGLYQGPSYDEAICI